MKDYQLPFSNIPNLVSKSGGEGRGRGRGGGSKQTHSRSYPRGVGLDFRKLAGLTLMGYIDHHGKYLEFIVFKLNIITFYSVFVE